MEALISSSSSTTTSTSTAGEGKDVVSNYSSTKSKSKSSGGGFFRFCGKYLAMGRNPPQSSNDNLEQRKYNNSSNGSGSKLSSELEQVFTYFDENGDGKISASELQTCLRAVGSCVLSDEDAEEAVRSSDSDGDGMLGFNDFAKLMETADDQDKIQELREAFGMYSDDHIADGEGGNISPKSLKKMLTKLGQSTTIGRCKAMISQFDLNGDGLLNFEEFRIMMH